MIWVALIVLLDQISKYFASAKLKSGKTINIINNFFELVYVENTGAGFGILKGRIVFFVIITSLVLLVLGFFLYKYASSIHMAGRIAIYLIMAGSIGNFIDRVRLGYVVDFLSFNIFGYDFPVFNVADISVVIGAGILIVMILFYEELLFD